MSSRVICWSRLLLTLIYSWIGRFGMEFLSSKHWGCFNGQSVITYLKMCIGQILLKIGDPLIFLFIYNCEGLLDLLTLQNLYREFTISGRSFAFQIIDHGHHGLKKSQLSCNCPVKHWRTIWL